MKRSRTLIFNLLIIVLIPACAQAPQAVQPTPSPVTTQPAIAPQTTATTKPPSSVLFLGDSLSIALDKYFPKLAASGDPPINIESKADIIFGSSLSVHWDSIQSEREEIRAGKWDVVVLEEDLGDRWPGGVENFHEYARKFYQEIKQAGAETILVMPWPNKEATSPSTDDIVTTLRTSRNELGVQVAPIALAFQRSLLERPDLDLYANDGDHPSGNGYFLSMCVLYATIFKRSPVGLSYRMEDLTFRSSEASVWSIAKGWTLSEQDAQFLQRIAWETVKDYQAAP